MENPHHQGAKLVTMTDNGRKAFEAAVKLQEPWVKALGTGLCKSRIDDAQTCWSPCASNLMSMRDAAVQI